MGVIIDGREWEPFVSRNMSFWHQCLSDLNRPQHLREFGVNDTAPFVNVIFNGTHTEVLVEKGKYKNYRCAALDAFGSKNKISELKRKYIIHGEALLNSVDKAIKKLTLTNWKDFMNKYSLYCAGLGLTAVLGRVASDKLIGRFREIGYKENEVDRIVGLITYPGKHTPLFDSRLDLFKIGEKIQDNKVKDIDKELLEWLSKYRHISVNFNEEPWTIDDAKKQLDEVLSMNCRDELRRLEDEHKKKVKKGREILNNIADNKVNMLALALREGTYLNEYRKNVFSKVSLEVVDIFKILAKKANLNSWRDCYYLTPDETILILEGKVKGINELPKKRKVIGMITFNDGRIELLNKEDTEKAANYIDSVYNIQGEVKSKDLNEKEIKGFSANGGIAKGVARIVFERKDFGKLKRGEILVTTMTSVDFVSVMEKALAFVTNEGGIICHASIVAREMNKPCVIATKIATKVIKDGDLVEVDANKGIVKILDKVK